MSCSPIALPTKRKRTCAASKKKKDVDAQYVCGLLNEIQDLLTKFEGNEVQALDVAIADFVAKYEHHEEEEESEGEEIKAQHSWSSDCSEHSSDRDFIASENEEEDGEYHTSEEEEEEEYGYESSQEEEEEEEESD
jgi:hypothetical protein